MRDPPNVQGTSLAYRAYKSVRPDEPSIAVDILYNQLYMLAIGIQMAGPNLTPASFEKGMFDYPRRTGPYGTWGFGPNDYSTSDDAREIFWNPRAVPRRRPVRPAPTRIPTAARASRSASGPAANPGPSGR